MNWSTVKTRIVDMLFHDVVQAKVQQAVGPLSLTLDPSNAGFRRLTDKTSPRDLPIPTQERMQEIAYFLWLTNPMAKWLLNMQVAYIVGEGVEMQAEDEAVKAIIETWWTDGVNQWPLKLPKKVRELAMFGEQCWPAFVAPGTGRVRLGYLDLSQIEEVVLDPDNAEQPVGVITKEQHGHVRVPQRRYSVILPVGEEELTPITQQLRQQFTDGPCFYFAINNVSNGSRGISDLFDRADWLDGYDQMLFQRLERSDLANRIVYDLTLNGYTQDQVTEFMKHFQLPKPGGVHGHNEKVTLEAKSPTMNSDDAWTDARMFKHQSLAPFPEHWFGGGGDVNRATASEMDEPTFKLLGERQKLWKAILEQVAGYSIRQAKMAGHLAQTAEETVTAVFPEMVTADLAGLGQTVQSVSQAVATLLAQEIITKPEARRMVSVIVKSFGVELEDLSEEDLEKMFNENELTESQRDVVRTARTRGAEPSDEPRAPSDKEQAS